MTQVTDSGPRLWGFPALPFLSVTSDLWLNLFVPHFLICIVMRTEPTSLSEEEFSEVSHTNPHNRAWNMVRAPRHMD